MKALPADLQKIVADLDAKIEGGEYDQHAVDVFTAIKDCIIGSAPIGQELQDQYVRIIANDQRQDRYTTVARTSCYHESTHHGK